MTCGLPAQKLGAAYHIQVWHIVIEHYLVFTDKSLKYISSYKGKNTKRNREGAGSAAQSTTMLDAYNLKQTMFYYQNGL